MRVLILGGNGMLGHKLVQSWRERFDVWATLRGDFKGVERFGIFDRDKTVERVSAENFDSIVNAFAIVKPQAVINCIGVIKQIKTVDDPVQTLTVNSVFPHRVAKLCGALGARFITLGTDCVFSGRIGNYSESDAPDATDLYGRSKHLGEAVGENCLTIRTSIIGRELDSAHSLIEWFLSNRNGAIKGYKNAIYSGFTTLEISDILSEVIENQRDLSGMWHVASRPISKFDLLKLVGDVFRANIEIEPDENFFCDRSLNGERFETKTNYAIPSWASMIERMWADSAQYDEWRGKL